VISNKYGFIFVHTPKTGGTSIVDTLNKDTDQECKILYDAEGGISAIYPSPEDFPWWGSWIQHAVQNRTAMLKGLQQQRIETNTPDLAFDFLPPGADLLFSTCSLNSVGNGNLKHVPLRTWSALRRDSRIQFYNSFAKKYSSIGTCRNPYKREFSYFLYQIKSGLQKEIEKAHFKDHNEVSEYVRNAWQRWFLGESLPTILGESSFLHWDSQISYLYDPFTNQRVTHLIRSEHLEQDYDKICRELSIPRKNEIPWLNTSPFKQEYTPKNILEWYTDEMMDLIHSHRKGDFDFLGYKKGSLR